MAANFHTTQWSLVLAARKSAATGAEEALASLCTAYWYPLYAFVRRQGYAAEEARDLTQGYFVRLLEKKVLRDVDPSAGRFRSFLLVSLKHFLANERDRERALKRGGGQAPIPLDDDAEDRYSIEPVEHENAEKLFERRWALTVLDRVKESLREEMVGAGKGELYEQLRDFIASGKAERPYREIAVDLGLNESAVKMAALRMRRRFGALLRKEIAQTVATREQIDGEIRHLLAALS